MSIAYVYLYSNQVQKTLHHAIGVTTTEAELFTIRCGIKQAIQIPEISHIIIITNSIHIVYQIFDSTVYPYQQQPITISKDLR